MFGWIWNLLLLAGVLFLLRGRRGRSFTKRFQALLDQAVGKNLITSDQRTALIECASAQRQGITLAASAWVAILAGLFVIAGLSLVISYNWAKIGPLPRVVAFLLLFVAVGEGYVRTRNRSRAIHLPLEFAWFFFPLLGIGLYAQTFQLSGDPIKPFLVWLALTFPLVWLSPYSYVGIVHFLALVAVLFTGNFTPGMLSLLTRQHGIVTAVDPVACLLTVVIWGMMILQTRRFLPPTHRTHLVGLGAIWIMSLLFAQTPLYIDHAGWLLTAGMAFSVLWMLTPLWSRSIERPTVSGAVPWLGLIYGMTFLWHADKPFQGTPSSPGLAVTILALVAAALVTYLTPLSRLQVRGAWAAVTRLCIGASIVLQLLALADNVIMLHSLAIAANLLLALIALLLMWHGGKVGVTNHVNVGVALLVLLLITRFIDVLGDMFRSGIGLMAAGLLLAALAYGLDRGRKKLIAMGREAAP
ncbi:MAG: DUF2157 domain-containing protein [Pseudomonadota bacterium]